MVDDNTIVLNNIRLNYKSALTKTNLKSSDNQRQKSLVFVGFIICYILVLESFFGMSYSVLYGTLIIIIYCLLPKFAFYY